ncbi:hypothetical protein KKG81_10820 [bacterium]|jgi:hypothetical protein|nr:hypothetical protein [bacterium]
MKNSFSLLEIILTLILSTIVIIYSTLFTKELFFVNKNNQNIEIAKINIQSTKIFFEKHKNELEFMKYENENLYFKDSLLLENVKSFTLNKNSEDIKITINFDDKIKQTWEFKL